MKCPIYVLRCFKNKTKIKTHQWKNTVHPIIILESFATREACIFTFKNSDPDNFFLNNLDNFVVALNCFRNSHQNWLNFIICHRWRRLDITRVSLATTAILDPEVALQNWTINILK